MKSLKHKDIHTFQAHLFNHIFTKGLCKDLKEKIAKKIEFLQKYQFAYLLKVIVLKNYLIFVNGLSFNKSINVKIFFGLIKFHRKLFHFLI
jgi:hypothetical protein